MTPAPHEPAPARPKETAAAKKRRRMENSKKRAFSAKDAEIAALKAKLATVCDFIQTHMAGTEALAEIMKEAKMLDLAPIKQLCDDLKKPDRLLYVCEECRDIDHDESCCHVARAMVVMVPERNWVCHDCADYTGTPLLPVEEALPALVAEVERLRAENESILAKQQYLYVGRDGKAVMARVLEDERDQLRKEVSQLRARQAILGNAFRPLLEACEEDFTNEHTEGPANREDDESAVACGNDGENSVLTFGHTRVARSALKMCSELR
jgi:hypothetical protein